MRNLIGYVVFHRVVYSIQLLKFYFPEISMIQCNNQIIFNTYLLSVHCWWYDDFAEILYPETVQCAELEEPEEDSRWAARAWGKQWTWMEVRQCVRTASVESGDHLRFGFCKLMTHTNTGMHSRSRTQSKSKIVRHFRMQMGAKT